MCLASCDRKSRITDYFLEPAGSFPPSRSVVELHFDCAYLEYVYDAFFNSPCGYRAQYALSPEIGSVLQPDDDRQAHTETDASSPLRLVMATSACLRSLHSTDAKIWIDELEVAKPAGRSTVTQIALSSMGSRHGIGSGPLGANRA